MAAQKRLQTSIFFLALTAVCLLGGAGCATSPNESSALDRIHSAKVERSIERIDNSLANSQRSFGSRQIASP
jgi:hypothetical protein